MRRAPSVAARNLRQTPCQVNRRHLPPRSDPTAGRAAAQTIPAGRAVPKLPSLCFVSRHATAWRAR
ncbi:hypothetical protein GCM10008024_17210 [Allgaiera indica]|uniref:Uncharacterized protein n=1 Tax=Allgaiera indica TaxID=765699 RepID=A0AAN4ZZ63_9RHOB|nr:hypothetical protein GCM10008024_17210 [Allgaiera indica]